MKPSWSPVLVAVLALAVAAASLGGIVVPVTYAHETPTWAAQGVGQDWVNLLVVVPLLLRGAAGARRGSPALGLLLGGALTYTLYSYVLYAFCVHFNWLFLVYCAALGLSFFGLAALLASCLRGDPASWFDGREPAGLAGGLLVALAVAFALLWLAEVVPALRSGVPPASVAEVGTFTNPVHVLDLSLFLPAMLLAGLSLRRRRPLGLVLGPMLLAFGALMLLAILGMTVSMRARAASSGAPPVAFLLALLLLDVAALAALLRHVKRDP